MRYQITFLNNICSKYLLWPLDLLFFGSKSTLSCLVLCNWSCSIPRYFFLWYLVQMFIIRWRPKESERKSRRSFSLWFWCVLSFLSLVASGLRDTCRDHTFSKTHHYPVGSFLARGVWETQWRMPVEISHCCWIGLKYLADKDTRHLVKFEF